MSTLLLLLLLISILSPTTLALQNTTTDNPSTKRGISWIGTKSSEQDNTIFASGNTPLTWYKSWGAAPIQEGYLSSLDFTPMIHSLDNMAGDIRTIASQKYEYVLTFNEPDGDTSGGGTAISAQDAAEAWADIVKLRDEHKKKISLPATTGSGGGWEWLREFNESCWEVYEETGCEFDFVAAHWYGAFEGLASWLGRLHEAYPDKGVWVTEFALPQPASVEEVQGMMNQSLAFLDGEGWVERYAWFGSFREDEANGWTGDVVSLLDDDGGLTELGAQYMGGEDRGFKVGQGEQNGAAPGGPAASTGTRLVWWSMLLGSVGFALLIG